MDSAGGESLRIVFLGTADFAVPALRSLVTGPDRIVGVITRPDRPAGRGRRLRPSSVRLAAVELGLPLYQPERVSARPGLEVLRGLHPDVLFTVAFGEILSEEALAVPAVGAVNLHASLLPRYRGAAPIQRALMAGERVTGVSVQWMAREMDAGDLILQSELAVGEEEDLGSLHDRLAALGAEAAAESVGLIRRGLAPRISQDDTQVSYAPPIRREELVIEWRKPAVELARLVRALSPRPGARTTRRGEGLKVLQARAARAMPGEDVKKDQPGGGIPGQVMELEKQGFWVKTGEAGLLVLRVQPAGRKAMSAADYLKGYQLQPGEMLGA